MAGIALSLRPSEFVQGGLIDDVDVHVTDAKFVLFDYNGKSDVAVPCLGIEFETTDGLKFESYYSAGDAKYWVPSEDGKTLIAVGDKKFLTNSCKLARFLQELVTIGFPEDRLAQGDISCLKGLKGHVNRKAEPKRQGLVRQGQDGKERDETTLVFTSIIALPGEAAKAGSATGIKTAAAAAKPTGAPASTKAAVKSPTPAAAPASASSPAVDEEAIAVVVGVLAESGGSIAKNKLSQAAFKSIDKSNTLRAAITSRVFQDEFLNTYAEQGGWSFDGTTVSMA